MTAKGPPRAPPEGEIEKEIREGRKFTPREALARLAGPGAMKGASPIPRQQQAEIEIGSWLASNLGDVPGALKAVLHRHLEGSPQLLENVDQPLRVLSQYCERLAASGNLLAELVREADVEWGRMMEERPHFTIPGVAPHPDDPYSVESVRAMLNEALRKLPAS